MKANMGVKFMLLAFNLDRNYYECFATYQGRFILPKIVPLSIRLEARWTTELILILKLHGESNILSLPRIKSKFLSPANT
jgi:hypothetical protein